MLVRRFLQHRVAPNCRAPALVLSPSHYCQLLSRRHSSQDSRATESGSISQHNSTSAVHLNSGAASLSSTPENCVSSSNFHTSHVRPPDLDASIQSPKQTSKSLLPFLAAQKPHYATLHIHARSYLLTQGDTVRLPFRIPKIQVGDTIRLTRASAIGSRDYTFRGSPYVDEGLFECRAVVVGVEAEPMRFKEKSTRRNRRVKTVKSKHRFTELTVQELRIKPNV